MQDSSLALQPGAAVLGIDLSRPSLAAARTHAPEIGETPPAYVRASALALPVRNASVAGVILADVLEHLDWPRAVREAARMRRRCARPIRDISSALVASRKNIVKMIRRVPPPSLRAIQRSWRSLQADPRVKGRIVLVSGCRKAGANWSVV